MSATEELDQAIKSVKNSEYLVVFTGAGVSTESGIPDFRSPGGIWDQFNPSDFTIQSLYNDPVSYWERRLEMEASRDFEWEEIDPNPAHRAIAELEDAGKLSSVITQNVDGLHQKAGNAPEKVLELHGTRSSVKCLDCDDRFEPHVLDEKLESEPLPPRCDTCDGLLKHATISFGEALPQAVLSKARNEAQESDCFVVVGSSLTVEPAASLPRIATRNGAELVIINLDSTPLDSTATAVITDKAGVALPKIVDSALE